MTALFITATGTDIGKTVFAAGLTGLLNASYWKPVQTGVADVVIAGGSNAAWLRSRLELPLVPIQANGFDLMEALARARRIAPRIGVVTMQPGQEFWSRFGHDALVVYDRDRITEPIRPLSESESAQRR